MRDWELPSDPLDALREGDPGPFEHFVRRSSRTFFGFFRRLGASVPRAEDLTQEMYLKLYQNAARYEARERFAAYCFRVARNVWIDARRRSAARPERGADEPYGAEGALDTRALAAVERPDPGPGPEERFTIREEAARLRRALRHLGEHHREVFELGVMQELSYAEIGSLLEIPVGTVKSRMHHAVKRLRALLEESP